MTQRIQDLYQKLLNIPFLKLGQVDNFDSMQQEAITAYEKHHNSLEHLHTSCTKDQLMLNLDVLGIFDYKGLAEVSSQCDSSLTNYLLKGKLSVPFKQGEKTVATKFSHEVPILRDYVRGLFEHPGRIRFSVLQPNKSVGWHTHYNVSTELTIHIPLITNSHVYAQVARCDFDQLTTEEHWFPESPKECHTQHFAPGEIWLLNSKHYHRLVNDGTTARAHMWATVYLYDQNGKPVNPSLVQLLESAANNYTGPLI
jgi:hypothetical protein